jgi:biopolymer transport protein ExbD
MKFRRTKRLHVKARVELTPLITILFQLILFFMLSATFAVQSPVAIQMAGAFGPVSLEQKDLSITLTHGTGGPDGKGVIYCNDTEVASFTELSHILQQAQRERPDLQVLVRPDARTQSARLIEVLSIVNAAGIDRCQIAAQPASEAPAPGTPASEAPASGAPSP